MKRRKTRRRKQRTIGQILARRLCAAAKDRARRKGLLFKLTPKNERSFAATIDAGKCPLSGLPFSFKGGILAPSLDRKVCTSPVLLDRSYTEKNTRIIAWGWNCAFNSFGEAAFMKMLVETLRTKATVWRPLQFEIVERAGRTI